MRDFYLRHEVEVSHDPDQYSTDFGKAMRKIDSNQTPRKQKDILILGTLAGRVDQGLGLLHEMTREETRDPTLRLFLFSETNVSFILKGGRNTIEGLKSSRFFTPNVGLVPIYGPSTITTSGLEWDVQDWETQMGGQVSTSNHVVADDVHVKTTAPILFTIERCQTTGALNSAG